MKCHGNTIAAIADGNLAVVACYMIVQELLQEEFVPFTIHSEQPTIIPESFNVAHADLLGRTSSLIGHTFYASSLTWLCTGCYLGLEWMRL